jgi:hypothetical protein
MKERKPLAREFAVRYRAAQSKVEKSKILDDFISAAGYNRKYAIGVPSSGQTLPSWPGNRGLGLPKTSGGSLFR